VTEHAARRRLARGSFLLAVGVCCAGATSSNASSPAVTVGLERIAAREHPAPRGPAGLLAHRAAVTRDGRHAIEVLRESGVDLVRLFSPEHGLRGEAAAGEAVPSGSDPRSGLPVVSLYGAKVRPTLDDLAGLEVLVVDLQDVGVRFYTYASTLLHCLDAAAEAGIELWVLDRPNPLGGERVEGPVADRERVPPSLINTTPGPLVHGLTLGEMALLANGGRAKPARLTVVPMRGWKRAMTWEDTQRPWTPPSPNLRTAAAALAYPGVALLEATNVSEGRGTERPFLLLGAPWLDPNGVARLARLAVPGFTLAPTRFVPTASPAAPAPKHLGVECAGVEVRVTAPGEALPYRLGLELLAALAREPGFAWREDGAALDRLLGTPTVFAELARGSNVEAVEQIDARDHEAWRATRRPFLLYE
jgi:uncharacterized protein YbbC (DUF1343 family)